MSSRDFSSAREAKPARAVASGSWDALARGVAQGPGGVEDTDLRRELLLLWLGGDPYALPVERVREIVRLRPITPMPRVPEAVCGVISLRGEIVQVVDLRCRLGLPPALLEEADADTLRSRRIVVLHGEDGQMTGLLVDRVSDVLRVTEAALRPASADTEAIAALCEHGSHFVSLFDVDRVLDLGGATP